MSQNVDQHPQASTSFEVDAVPLKQTSRRPFHLENRMNSKRSLSQSPDLAETKRQAMLEARRQRLALRANHIKESVDRHRMEMADQRTVLQSTLAKNQTDAEANRKERIRTQVEQSALKVKRAKDVAQQSRQHHQETIHKQRSRLQERLDAGTFRRHLLAKVPRSKLLDESVVTVELVRSKHAAKRIQRWFRLSSVKAAARALMNMQFSGQFGVLDIKSMTIEQLMSTIQSAELIDRVTTLLQRVRLVKSGSLRMKNSTKVFLSAYMIVYHTEEIMPQMGETEQVVKDCAAAMLSKFDGLLQDPSWSVAGEFADAWYTFHAKFQEWKAKDTQKMLDTLFEHFMQLEQLWESVKAQVDAEKEWKPRIDMQQKNIKAKVLRIGGKSALGKLLREQKNFRGTTSEVSESEGQSGPESPSTSRHRRTDSVSSSHMETTAVPAPSAEQPHLNDVLREYSNMMTNERLAHELIVDPEFELKPNNGTLEAQVRAMAKRAFFDQVRSQKENLNWVPSVVADVRESLLSMVDERSKIHREVREVLDAAFVEQQVANQVIDVKRMLTFISEKMLQLCAPVRDSAIRQLAECDDFATAFERILAILDDMKLDLANYRLQSLRPHLMKQAVEYERSKFERALASGQVSLKKTEEWLGAAAQKVLNVAAQRNPQNIDIPENRVRYESVYIDALLSLLFGTDAIGVEQVPETFGMDAERLFGFQNELQAMTIVAALTMLTKNFVPELRDERTVLAELKKNLFSFLKDADTTVENLALLILTAAEGVLARQGKQLTEEKRSLVQNMVDKTLSYKDTVYLLLNRRIRDSIRVQLTSGRFRRDSNNGLEIVQEEMEAISRKIYILAKHNRDVFAPWYDEIIQKVLN